MTRSSPRRSTVAMPARSSTAIALAANAMTRTVAVDVDGNLTVGTIALGVTTKTVGDMVREIVKASYTAAGAAVPSDAAVINAACAEAVREAFGGLSNCYDDR